jgi:hypothetical protein
MLGIVIEVNSVDKSALLQVSGVKSFVYAPFGDIENAIPRELEISEIVSCDLQRRGGDGRLRAAKVRILFGKTEADAIRQMTPSASWEQGQRRARAAGKASGKQ